VAVEPSKGVTESSKVVTAQEVAVEPSKVVTAQEVAVEATGVVTNLEVRRQEMIV
jgi:hypothetical protein